MDPVTIGIIIAAVIKLIEVIVGFMTTLRGQPLTAEQQATLREQLRKIIESIDEATPVPAPPGEGG